MNAAIALPIPRGRRRRSRVPSWLRGLRAKANVVLASFSDVYEKKVLEHHLGKASTTMPTSLWIGLTTVVPTDADTGTTITEANYTGYARKLMTLPGDWAAATGTSPGSISTAVLEQFAACTAGTSTVIGLVITDAATLGNVVVWTTVTSVTINATQQPAQIASGALSVTQD
jgi:hypothetical protein